MLAWLDTKISNVKEEKKKVTRGVWMHHTPPRQGSPLTVKKKEKVKVNKALQSYRLFEDIERKRYEGDEKNESLPRERESSKVAAA